MKQIATIGCGVALGVVVAGIVLFFVIGALLYPDYLAAGIAQGSAR